MSKENGGPAFPNVPSGAGEKWVDWDQGMTLRDYFAAHALAGLCAHAVGPAQNRLETSAEAHARAAYLYADEMLAERAK